jgi:AcrR family transcriptional regulator
MRALARELGVPPMTIYHYAPSREYLHALVVDDILSEIRVPGNDEGSWEERLRTLLFDARRVFAEHPGVSAHFGDGGSGEGARLAEGVLAILAAGGFSSEGAVVCFATIFTFMTGQIDLDAMSHFVAQSVQVATLDNVTQSSQFSREELFEFGYDAVIEGLKHNLLQSEG